MFELNQEQANEFMAVKPYLGVVKNSVPSYWKDSSQDLSEPNHSLELEFIHGYWCFDTRNNIFFVSENEILFHSAAVVIKMNIKSNLQQFNFGNTDDITAIAKFQGTAATGQIGKNPIINIIDLSSMTTK